MGEKLEHGGESALQIIEALRTPSGLARSLDRRQDQRDEYTPDIAALIAPRPLHLNFGELDRGSPVDESRRAIQRIARTYQDQNAAEIFSTP